MSKDHHRDPEAPDSPEYEDEEYVACWKPPKFLSRARTRTFVTWAFSPHHAINLAAAELDAAGLSNGSLQAWSTDDYRSQYGDLPEDPPFHVEHL